MLQAAWQWLEALVQSYGDAGDTLRTATGIHNAYVAWWTVEAKRRRMVETGDSEIEALQHAIEKARVCVDSGGWQGPWHDLRLMTLLFQIADAFDRLDSPSKAAVARAEADEIFARRRFPETAKRIEKVATKKSLLSELFWKLRR